MNCDLCAKRHVHSDKSKLCDGCAEMVQRLIVVKQRMESLEPLMTAAVAAGASSQGHFLSTLR